MHLQQLKTEAEIGIIGGTGVYDQSLFSDIETIKVTTPYGPPSDQIEVGRYHGRRIAFIPRHGRGHVIPPHKVNYRANIWVLKALGVTRILSPCAVGSLNMDFHPGELVFTDQFVDFTKQRDYTFYDGGKTIHISTADPFCPELRAVMIETATSLGIDHHDRGTYICIEGPRFSTRAESKMFRSFGDVIGMTLVPECQLARELEICYVSLAMITDYDVWADKPVDTQEIVATIEANQDHVKNMLRHALDSIGQQRECPCQSALKYAEV